MVWLLLTILKKNELNECNFYLEPPIISGKIENITVNEGQDAILIVKFTGKPKPLIKWFKEEILIDTTIIESFEQIDLEDSSTLIIKSVKNESSGSYYTQLSNEVATINSNKALVVVNSMWIGIL